MQSSPIDFRVDRFHIRQTPEPRNHCASMYEDWQHEAPPCRAQVSRVPHFRCEPSSSRCPGKHQSSRPPHLTPARSVSASEPTFRNSEKEPGASNAELLFHELRLRLPTVQREPKILGQHTATEGGLTGIGRR